jgi:TonB family protein
MKLFVLFFSLVLLSACSSTQETTGLTLPELIYQYPLPAFPKPLLTSHLRIGLKILVSDNGSVRTVELLNSSGIPEWDSTAIEAIRQWKYSPARYNNKPLTLWLRQTAIVKFSDPHYMQLAEIMFEDEGSADSAFALLEQGTDFTEVVQKFSIASSRSSNGSLGTVNVQIFPEQVKKIILQLDNGSYSAPVKYGEHFAIFKRLKD